jgi:outer membrane protein
MKRFWFVFILAVFISSFVWSEQLSQIAVIDLSKIVSNYFKESQAWRELEEMTEEYEAEKEAILEEIEQLEARKIEAQNEGEDAEALEIDDEIFNKKEYLQEYSRIKYNQIQKKRNSLIESPTFLSEILNVIKYVAENEGYAVVMRSKDPDLMWWSSEVDITNLVLQRLREISN